MKKYIKGKEKKLQYVKCNMCEKELEIHKGILAEGALLIDYEWNYFSNKDGEIHSFDLCEECYDNLIKNLKIPVDIEKRTELM